MGCSAAECRAEREAVCCRSAEQEAGRSELYEWIRRAQRGDEEARELLVLRNGGLVRSLAMRFCGMGTETEDLLQLGYLGLLKAIDRFDPSYGLLFSTYAVPLILGEIRRYLRDDGAIKMGRRKKQQVRDLKKTREGLEKALGRSPKLSELAEALHCSAEETAELLSAEEALGVQESLDDPLRFGEEPQEDYREDQEQQALRMDLQRALGSLETKERQIVVLRYFRDQTQQQIADRLQLSQVQVSRLEKKILVRMRAALE